PQLARSIGEGGLTVHVRFRRGTGPRRRMWSEEIQRTAEMLWAGNAEYRGETRPLAGAVFSWTRIGSLCGRGGRSARLEYFTPAPARAWSTTARDHPNP